MEFRKDDAAFRAGLPRLEEAAPFAAAIGCPRMMTYILSSSETPKDELRRTYKKRFTECADILARSHCRLGLEFLGPLHIRQSLPHEFIWKMPEMLEFAKECGSNVGLTLDAWHWHHAGGTVADILAAGRDRIVVVHFDDSPGLPPEQIRDNQRLLPGEGVIDLERVPACPSEHRLPGLAERGGVRPRVERDASGGERQVVSGVRPQGLKESGDRGIMMDRITRRSVLAAAAAGLPGRAVRRDEARCDHR